MWCGLDAPAHPSTTMLWPRVTCFPVFNFIIGITKMISAISIIVEGLHYNWLDHWFPFWGLSLNLSFSGFISPRDTSLIDDQMLHLLAPYFWVAPWIWLMLLVKMSRRGYGSMFRNVEVIDFHTASAASATVLQFKYQELSYPPNWQRSSASTSLPMTIGNYTRLFTN